MMRDSPCELPWSWPIWNCSNATTSCPALPETAPPRSLSRPCRPRRLSWPDIAQSRSEVKREAGNGWDVAKQQAWNFKRAIKMAFLTFSGLLPLLFPAAVRPVYGGTLERNMASPPSSPCYEQWINTDWKFYRVDGAEPSGLSRPDTSETGWETVSLPHTPRIEKYDETHPWQGICWYRKTLAPDPGLGGEARFCSIRRSHADRRGLG